MSLYKKVAIGNVTTNGNLFVAPLAGYTDAAFRHICLAQGADLAFSEMVSCEGLWRENESTRILTRRAAGEEILALQLFGGNVEAVQKSVPVAMKANPQILDFNCGCPVPKVHRSHSGSALLQDPVLFHSLLKTLRQEAPSHVAVTVKIRSGWDSEKINYPLIAEKALDAGVDMITLHPRTRAQGYTGFADWQHLKDLKRRFPQAVICGSGDLFAPEDAKRMLEETGIDAVMFARGVIGNPTIFTQTRSLLTQGSYEPVDSKTKKQIAFNHLQAIFAIDRSVHAVRDFKKHLISYAKGIPDWKPMRETFARLEDPQAAVELLQSVM